MEEKFYKYEEVVYDGEVFEVIETPDKNGRMRISPLLGETHEIIWVDEGMVVSLPKGIKLGLIDSYMADEALALIKSRKVSSVNKNEPSVVETSSPFVGKDGSGKNDRADGKLRWDLLPLAEIEDIVRVYTEGAKKYADNSWQDIPDGFNRYLGALMRHLVAYTKGERYDKEGFMHLSAVCWNAIALLHYDKHNKGLIEWKSQEKE